MCVCAETSAQDFIAKNNNKKNRSTTQEPGLLDENNNRCSSSIQGTEFFYGAH